MVVYMEDCSIKIHFQNTLGVLWTAGYVPPDAKNYKIIVRATDKTGKVQTSELTNHFQTELLDITQSQYKKLLQTYTSNNSSF